MLQPGKFKIDWPAAVTVSLTDKHMQNGVIATARLCAVVTPLPTVPAQLAFDLRTGGHHTGSPPHCAVIGRIGRRCFGNDLMIRRAMRETEAGNLQERDRQRERERERERERGREGGREGERERERERDQGFGCPSPCIIRLLV